MVYFIVGKLSHIYFILSAGNTSTAATSPSSDSLKQYINFEVIIDDVWKGLHRFKTTA